MVKNYFVILFIFLTIIFVVNAHFIASDPKSEYEIYLFFDNANPLSQESEKFRINILNPVSGLPIETLDKGHESILHVFIVRNDLDFFDHMRVEDFADGLENSIWGSYTFNYTFPMAGKYAIAVSYTPHGITFLNLENASIAGKETLAAPNYDFALEKNFDGYDITLKHPKYLEAEKEHEFNYYIRKNGVEISDLQLYLGSEINLFVIKDDLSSADLAHSYVPKETNDSEGAMQLYYGPTVPVHLIFKTPGKYVLFGEFKHDGKVIKTKFMVDVKPKITNLMNSAYNYYAYVNYVYIILILVAAAISYIIWRRMGKPL
ncbi:MAG TPA: hypothetical protein VJJ52_04945 [Candidatus Nanoarchaeia archaeon]|nr:hypothetical protein [Candidatus Nanoarchaeia archaeon]